MVSEHYDTLVQASKAEGVQLSLTQEVEATAAAIAIAYLTEEIPKAIQQSLEGIERVASIMHAMQEFSYPGNGDKTAMDLNKASESTITVARNEWKHDVVVQKHSGTISFETMEGQGTTFTVRLPLETSSI